jgi:hypothetical protein
MDHAPFSLAEATSYGAPLTHHLDDEVLRAQGAQHAATSVTSLGQHSGLGAQHHWTGANMMGPPLGSMTPRPAAKRPGPRARRGKSRGGRRAPALPRPCISGTASAGLAALSAVAATNPKMLPGAASGLAQVPRIIDLAPPLAPAPAPILPFGTAGLAGPGAAGAPW